MAALGRSRNGRIWAIININQERERIEELANAVDWLKGPVWVLVDGLLCLDAEILAHDSIYPIRMKYPSVYPNCPPAVNPRCNLERNWSSHQYGRGGELCLEIGPDNWEPGYFGEHMLQSAFKLLRSENPDGNEPIVEIPSRHTSTIGRDVRHSRLRLVVENELNSALEHLPVGSLAEVELHCKVHKVPSLACIALAHSVKYRDEVIWKNRFVPTGIATEWSAESCVYCSTRLKPGKLREHSRSTLIKLLNSHVEGFAAFIQENPLAAFILVSDTKKNLHLFWTTDVKGTSCLKFLTVASSSASTVERLGEQYCKLKDKNIGIVGLGSVGSKIAISLARSGVSDFFLVDDDILLPENICRHALNWNSIGLHKVDAVSKQIQAISTNCTVKVRPIKLSGQESTSAVGSALGNLSECDLIVDATCDPTTFLQLSGIAQQFNKPLIWLEIFAGGIGGLLARYRPGIEPYPHLMRRALHQSLEDKQGFPGTGDMDYSSVDEHDRIVIAQDANVGVLSNHATQMALDVLADRTSRKFPHAIYLIGLDEAWLFDQPFRTIPIDLSNVQPDEEQIESSPDETKKSIEIIRQMIARSQHDDNTDK